MANEAVEIPQPVMFHSEKESPPCDAMVIPQSPENNNDIGYMSVTFNDRVFIGSLQPEVGEDQLRTVFGKEGDIKDCKIVREGSNRSKGYGFVTFKNPETVGQVLARPPGYYIYKGRPWNVSTAIRRVSAVSSPPASAGFYPYMVSPVQPNYMYPYVTGSGYYFPPGSPFSAASSMSQGNQFVYPPAYPYVYSADMFPNQEYQQIDYAAGDAAAITQKE